MRESLLRPEKRHINVVYTRTHTRNDCQHRASSVRTAHVARQRQRPVVYGGVVTPMYDRSADYVALSQTPTYSSTIRPACASVYICHLPFTMPLAPTVHNATLLPPNTVDLGIE